MKYEVLDEQGVLIKSVEFREEDQKHVRHEVNLLRMTNPEYTYEIG